MQPTPPGRAYPRQSLITTVVFLTWAIVAVLVFLWNQLGAGPSFCERPYEAVCSPDRAHAGQSRPDGKAAVMSLWQQIRDDNPTLSEPERLRRLALAIYTPKRVQGIVDS